MPDGNFKELRASGELISTEKGKGSFWLAARDYRVWALFIVYAACFGIELTINNIAAIYYMDYFDLGLKTAGLVAGLFGLMNIFARTLGGFISDKFVRRSGLKGRVRWLFIALLIEGVALVFFSQMRVLALAIPAMIVFSLFVQMSEGATYSIVPFINKKALGSVAGIVGAGGNMGAVCAGFLFRSESLDYRQALFMTWFQHWTSAIDWPINIGGKPWDSLPAFAPIIFESMVLCAGLGTVLVFFLVARLWPGKRSRLIVDGVTNDRFALVVQHDDPRYDLDEVQGLFTHCNPTAIEERVEDLVGGRLPQPDKPRDPRYLGWVNMALCALFVVVVVVNLFAPRNLSRPNWEVFPEMVRSPAYDSLSENSVLAGGITLQPPVPGAIARGMPPIHFDPATAKEEPAGRVSPENPFPADDLAVLERGAEVFQGFCACCHGATGGGDGLVTLRSSAAPPPFATGKSREWSDGQLFHLLTYGNTYGNGAMPAAAGQVRRDDRWKVIHFVRHLEAKATKAAEQAAAAAGAAAAASPADGDKETAAAETGESQP